MGMVFVKEKIKKLENELDSSIMFSNKTLDQMFNIQKSSCDKRGLRYIGIGSFSHLVQSHLLLLNDGQSLFSHDHVQQWQRAL